MDDPVGTDRCIEALIGKRQVLGVALLKASSWNQPSRQFDDFLCKVESGGVGTAFDCGGDGHPRSGADVENVHTGFDISSIQERLDGLPGYRTESAFIRINGGVPADLLESGELLGIARLLYRHVA